jgi:hypothetical protein
MLARRVYWKVLWLLIYSHAMQFPRYRTIAPLPRYCIAWFNKVSLSPSHAIQSRDSPRWPPGADLQSVPYLNLIYLLRTNSIASKLNWLVVDSSKTEIPAAACLYVLEIIREG